MSPDDVLQEVWKSYRERFGWISIGTLIVLVFALLLQYTITGLERDLLPSLLVTSFLFGGIYTVSRYSVADGSPMELLKVFARYILNLSVFSLLVALGLLLPDVVRLIYEILIVAVFFLAIPFLADLGYIEGCRAFKEMVESRWVTLVGLNLFFFLGMLALLSLTMHKVLAPVGFLLLIFLFLPIYSLTGHHLTHLVRGKK